MIKYIIISPVKNEEQYIEKTISSVISQTILPIKWIIVNDGSVDGTGRILEKYSQEYPWIHILQLTDKGFRAGTGPALAFNRGFEEIKGDDFDFIVNLDGDISFENDYFQKLFEKFKQYPKLGIASGKSYYLENGKLIYYRSADYSTMGPSKVYRKACFSDIGGILEPHICWDMVDDLKAQMKGWETKSFSDITFIHYKRIGYKQDAGLGQYFNEGKIAYRYGYHPLFFFLKSFYRGLETPYLGRTLAMLSGYFKAMIGREPQIENKEMIKFLQELQIKRIFNR